VLWDGRTNGQGMRDVFGGVGGFNGLLPVSNHSSLVARAPFGRPSSGYQVSCYGDFLRQQMRRFHDLLRRKPPVPSVLSEL
jgi:hypothetical protein